MNSLAKMQLTNLIRALNVLIGYLINLMGVTMLGKLWSLIIIVFALVIAILAVSLSQDAMRPIFVITTFFDVMIPILAVGALIKYIVCCRHCHNKD